VNFVLRFPDDLIGDAEVERIIVSGEWSEVEALFCNPQCSDQMLEDLFSGNGVFQEIEEERRVQIIQVATKNARISTDNSDFSGPDLGYYGICRGIVHLFDNVPVTPLWFWALYNVLQNIQPHQIGDNFFATLDRWKHFEIYGTDKKPLQSDFIADLTIADQFRCMFASVFGGLKDEALKGARSSDYLPLRCAYYSHADMKIKPIFNSAIYQVIDRQ
jgi:hypothetical protein